MQHEALKHILSLHKTGEIVEIDKNHYPVGIQGSTFGHLEVFSKEPYRVRATPSLPSLKAFVGYIEQYKTANTVVFADEYKGKMTAIFDYHTKENASWCTHTAEFVLKDDPDYERVISLDGQSKTPFDAIVALTDYNHKFVFPTPADVLEIISTLQVKAHTSSKRKDSLDGQSREVNSSVDFVVMGDKKISGIVFKIKLPVFRGVATEYEVPFRIIPSVKNGEEYLNFRFVRLHAVKEAAFQDVCAKMPTDIKVFGADPEAKR
jgi:uncharacterized protein YfdQ (DUF2303 family)